MASPFLDSVAEQAPAAQADLPGAQLGWLETARRQQLQAFLDDGLPGSRNESWKYTSLRAFA
ncbi:MAG: Fe-S cluster assembly protein SufD, partial [Rhodanobacteraceae bacterium]